MNNFKIGVMVESFRSGIKGGLEKASKVGAQGVQMYATTGELAPENMTSAKIKEVRDMVSSNGLVISAICGDLGGCGFMSAEENIAKVEKSKRIMDLALELGTNIVTTHIGIVPETVNETYKTMQAACNELAKYGDSVGAYFAIETGPEPASRLKGFLDSLDAKAVRVNFDPANLAMVIGENPVESAQILLDYIVHTHAKDGIMLHKTNTENIYHAVDHENIEKIEYFREVPLGEGSVDFDKYLDVLKKANWKGFLTIEREVGDNPEADIIKAVNFLKERI